MNPSELKAIAELEQLLPYMREYQALAEKHGISDIYQDNGGKTLQMLLLTDLLPIRSRSGNDAVDQLGYEYEFKSINIDSKATGFSTHHHMNKGIIAKYRGVDWVFAVYDGIELKEIYKLTPAAMEEQFSKWETKLENGKDHLTNQHIPLKYVREHGERLYSSAEGVQQVVSPNFAASLAKLEELFPYVREYQALAEQQGVKDIFQNNNGRTLEMLLRTGLKEIRAASGNDAVDQLGQEYEFKSINIRSEQGKSPSRSRAFSTHHHMNEGIIDKYRKADWVFGVYDGIELTAIYQLPPSALEGLFSRWEGQLQEQTREGKKAHLNNPHIPLAYVREKGTLVYHCKEGVCEVEGKQPPAADGAGWAHKLLQKASAARETSLPPR